jgi:hypothetical protein
MDTTKAEPQPPPEPPTLPDGSRTVADSGAATKPPVTPAEIRDHELIRRIGQGSYGEVWLTTGPGSDSATGKEFALLKETRPAWRA